MRFVVVALVACSGSAPRAPRGDACPEIAWSCVTLAGETPVSCTEGDATTRAAHEATCAPGAFTLGPCLRDRAVVGCARGCTTTWFHAPHGCDGARVTP